MSNTKITWADKSWNPVTGCAKTSPGCQNCYAERMSYRLQAMGQKRYKDGFKVACHIDALDEPDKWKKPSRIFVCSMGDLFHIDVPYDFLDEVFSVMALNNQHTYLVLTKRPENMKRYLGQCPNFIRWPLSNVWLGVTAENQEQADKRIPILLQIPAAKRFVSVEPMLGPVDLWAIKDGSWYDSEGADYYNSLDGHSFWSEGDYGLSGGPKLDWVICGGESGPGARPMHPDWARGLRDQCKVTGTPFLFKQWGEWVTEEQSPEDIVLPSRSYYPEQWDLFDSLGGVFKVGKHKAGRLLDGELWDQYPVVVL